MKSTNRNFPGVLKFVLDQVKLDLRYPSRASEQQLREHRERIDHYTPLVVRNLERSFVDGLKVTDVGDVEWWPYMGRRPPVLAAVMLENGTARVVGNDGTRKYDEFYVPLSTDAAPMTVLTSMPRLEHDDGFEHNFYIRAETVTEEHILFEHRMDKTVRHGQWVPEGQHKWRYAGHGYSGTKACRESAKHGVFFDFDEGHDYGA